MNDDKMKQFGERLAYAVLSVAAALLITLCVWLIVFLATDMTRMIGGL